MLESRAQTTFGGQLDQQEFKETRRGLRWLATCHMGHYRNGEQRYRADFLPIVVSHSLAMAYLRITESRCMSLEMVSVGTRPGRRSRAGAFDVFPGGHPVSLYQAECRLLVLEDLVTVVDVRQQPLCQ